ncbi:MAG TPA: malto-oligosyltrehalose synthase [Candidatus Xenobia bacterium]|jgi:(1->4)-alpha-D-glucan 1-alpha-D-glucosylmutase
MLTATYTVAESLYAALKADPPRTLRPSSTYRLQLNRDFPFAAAVDLIPYLHQLGISHVYASPCSRAMPGSPHGYDVLDHAELNPELGTPDDFKHLVETLRQHGMGLIVDFVSNHIGIGQLNPYWMDLLEGGPASSRAAYFDIDWKPTRSDLSDRVLVPVLGEQYGDVLEKGQLRIRCTGTGFEVVYFEHVLPLTVNSWWRILERKDVPPELDALLSDVKNLPPPYVGTPVGERTQARDAIRTKLAGLMSDAVVARHVEACLSAINGQTGDPASFDELDRLLADQPWRLAHWRVAGEEINYRRFFDINGLAAIRMEDPAVFAQMHRLVLAWDDKGVIDGLRIDHPDGLYNPSAYFARLQEEHVVSAARQRWNGEGQWPEIEAWIRQRFSEEVTEGRAGTLQRSFYVVAEKILASSERMPSAWAIDGTTGYEFLNALNGLFVQRSNAEAIDGIYRRFTRRRRSFHDMVYRKKKLVMAYAMASEINMLTRRLCRIAWMNRRTKDFTGNSLRRVLVEYIACLGIYRTYADENGLEDRDQRYVEEAISRARRKAAGLDASIFNFLLDVLTLRLADGERRDAVLTFVMKLQQLTGAITAKGVEDTCFFLYNRLISLNEVGGEPQRFGASPADFHAKNEERLRVWPGALSATSTHDTKRSEDVRARINVLSEIPEEWKYHLWLWNRMHMRHKQDINGRLVPDRNEEYYFYQTLVGTWPRTLSLDDEYRRRIQDTMRKTLREAKVHSSWLNSDVGYETAVLAFVDRVLEGNEAFMADMIGFMRRVALAGLHNSLSQVLLKTASPGVPDIYQGCELWDDSLVDPDNRRPVDYPHRFRMLDAVLEDSDVGELYASLHDPLEEGRLKLFVTARLLRFRRQHADLFARGRYLPAEAVGPLREHVCALVRQLEGQTVVAVAPRHVYRMLDPDGLLTPQSWPGTWLPVPEGRFVDILSGATLTSEKFEGRTGLWLGKVLEHLPVALLWRSEGEV